jgi:hypothetical protein
MNNNKNDDFNMYKDLFGYQDVNFDGKVDFEDVYITDKEIEEREESNYHESTFDEDDDQDEYDDEFDDNEDNEDDEYDDLDDNDDEEYDEFDDNDYDEFDIDI